MWTTEKSPQFYNICINLKKKTILDLKNGFLKREMETHSSPFALMDIFKCASKGFFESAKKICAIKKRGKLF